jgi:hypothetical protein
MPSGAPPDEGPRSREDYFGALPTKWGRHPRSRRGDFGAPSDEGPNLVRIISGPSRQSGVGTLDLGEVISERLDGGKPRASGPGTMPFGAPPDEGPRSGEDYFGALPTKWARHPRSR